MMDLAIGIRFVRAVAVRDWAALSTCFASDAKFRAVAGVGAFHEQSGPADITGQIKAWFQDGDVHELLESSVEAMVDRIHVRYRIHEAGGWFIVEQHAFLQAGPSGITGCDLLCSGFRPIDPLPAGDLAPTRKSSDPADPSA